MITHHVQLASGAWKKLSFVEQMANVGSEVERSIKWKNKAQLGFFQKSFQRVIELLYLTTESQHQNQVKLKELLRVKECLIDYFVFDNTYRSTELSWQKYFRAFNYVARKNK